MKKLRTEKERIEFIKTLCENAGWEYEFLKLESKEVGLKNGIRIVPDQGFSFRSAGHVLTELMERNGIDEYDIYNTFTDDYFFHRFDHFNTQIYWVEFIIRDETF